MVKLTFKLQVYRHFRRLIKTIRKMPWVILIIHVAVLITLAVLLTTAAGGTACSFDLLMTRAHVYVYTM